MSMARSVRTLGWCVLLFAALARADDTTKESGPEAVLLATHSVHGLIPVKSWKTLRDERIIKQDLDYSCGAASMATLLNSFHGQSVTEDALLKAMDKGDGRASFEDMARAPCHISVSGLRALPRVGSSLCT